MDKMPHVVVVWRDRDPFLQVIEYPNANLAHGSVYAKCNEEGVQRVIVAIRVRQTGLAQFIAD